MSSPNVANKDNHLLTLMVLLLLPILMWIQVTDTADVFFAGQVKKQSIAEYTQTSSEVGKEFAETCYADAMNDNIAYNPEDVSYYCNNFRDIAQKVINSYGADGTTVFLMRKSDKLCGESVVACVISGENIVHLTTDDFPYSEAIKTNHKALRSVMAHELVHVLTSPEEFEYLDRNADMFANSNGIEGAEVVADCGIAYFLEDYYTAYIEKEACLGLWNAITVDVIENTLVE